MNELGPYRRLRTSTLPPRHTDQRPYRQHALGGGVGNEASGFWRVVSFALVRLGETGSPRAPERGGLLAGGCEQA